MPIEFACTGCQKLLRVPDTSAGKRARCPNCGHIQAVPDAAFAAEPTAQSFSPDEAYSVPRGDGPTVNNPFAESSGESPFAAQNPFADQAASGAAPPKFDSMNPYAAPRSEASTVVPRESIRMRVEGPATTLMVLSGIVLAFTGLGLIFQVVVAVSGDGNAGEIVAGIAGSLIGFAIYGMVMHGANQMKELRNYQLAVTASILAMLPCSGCCIIGLPVGIWSLIVLSDPVVKSAFR